MPNDRMWKPPQTPSEAVDTLDMLSDTIQFVADLTAQPSPPINEYTFSQDGYSGLYFFLCFVQGAIADCQDAITNKVETGLKPVCTKPVSTDKEGE